MPFILSHDEESDRSWQACRPRHTRHTQILADQLNLFQPGGTDYARLITTGTPGFSDLPMALIRMQCGDHILFGSMSDRDLNEVFQDIYITPPPNNRTKNCE